MTDEEVLMLGAHARRAEREGHEYFPVRVVASDYRYDGWLVTAFAKRSGKLRCVVEDIHGRLFIHNSSQLTAAKLPSNPE